jgi:hypothetical protein
MSDGAAAGSNGVNRHTVALCARKFLRFGLEAAWESYRDQALEQARAIAFLKLEDLRKYLLAEATADTALRAHYLFAATQIKRFEDDPKQIGVNKPA